MFRDSGRYSEDGDDEPEAMSDTNDTVENSDPQTKQVATLMALEDGTGGTLMPTATRTGEADIEAELQAECGWYVAVDFDVRAARVRCAPRAPAFGAREISRAAP